MITIEEIVKELEGKETDRETINSCLKKYGPKTVRVALLGIASQKRIYNPYWIGCPPTCFCRTNGMDLHQKIMCNKSMITL